MLRSPHKLLGSQISYLGVIRFGRIAFFPSVDLFTFIIFAVLQLLFCRWDVWNELFLILVKNWLSSRRGKPSSFFLLFWICLWDLRNVVIECEVLWQICNTSSNKSICYYIVHDLFSLFVILKSMLFYSRHSTTQNLSPRISLPTLLKNTSVCTWSEMNIFMRTNSIINIDSLYESILKKGYAQS